MDSVRVDGMAARDVVPQTTEPRGFLRRRKTDEPAPPPLLPPVAEAPEPVIAMSVLVPVTAPEPAVVPPPVEPVHVEVEPLLPALPAEPAPVQQSDELFRAQAALLQAALRQADELTAALVHEQQLRRQETERLTAEIQLLRDALATLNTQALQRRQEVAAAPTVNLLLPEQREHAPAVQPHEEPAAAVASPEQPQDAYPLQVDTEQRQGRRRSARQAGPA